MACYDVVKVQCPSCDRWLDFQSKGGECKMEVYTLRDAPNDVLSDVNRHAPINCKCGKLVVVQLQVVATARTL